MNAEIRISRAHMENLFQHLCVFVHVDNRNFQGFLRAACNLLT